MLLSVALKPDKARMVVSKENQLYVVEDHGGDVCQVEVKEIQRVKTMLGRLLENQDGMHMGI